MVPEKGIIALLFIGFDIFQKYMLK